jgi:hypothetical protein
VSLGSAALRVEEMTGSGVASLARSLAASTGTSSEEVAASCQVPCRDLRRLLEAAPSATARAVLLLGWQQLYGSRRDSYP